MKKLLINLLRWGLPLAIVAYLVQQAMQNDSFARLRDEPKHWGLLALATVAGFAAVSLCIVRWYLLVRALEIPFRLRDAFRLGFLGYLLNFVSPGSTGGDLFKTVFLARERPGKFTESAITVVVDRVLGLYGLILVATTAILLTGVWRTADSVEVRVTARAIFWFAGIATALFIWCSLPTFGKGPIARWLLKLPRVGRIIERMVRANHMYLRRIWVLIVAVGISMLVHSCFAICVWLTARGLLSEAPSLAAHFVMVPLALATGGLPLALNGLGAFEAVLDFLYRHVPGGTEAAPSAGLLVALGYRVITVLVAAIGAVVYLCSRREMSEVLHEAEEVAEGNYSETRSTQFE